MHCGLGPCGRDEHEEVVWLSPQVDSDLDISVRNWVDNTVDVIDFAETCEGKRFCCSRSFRNSSVFCCRRHSSEASLFCSASAASSVAAIIFEKAAIASSRCFWEIMAFLKNRSLPQVGRKEQKARQ